ncbi:MULTISPECIES: phage portal protein [unclassified Crossiella]|uniref:phage portal protein n=1 Tax=unclassified Crossiella TaxID=2620835 RepID=UPI001FFEA0F9|nr:MULTISPECIES: phage portal protein [unclassified Crossiella]MCK2237716.1 phage portal protein [Crossiella sp. S99.2]MCK2255002.1 phage portal protein [Crossiella sp. S99.1]
MTLSQTDASDTAGRLRAMWPDQARNERVLRYVRGDHDLPFAPRNARNHYRWTLERSRTNWCKLLVSLISQNLFVDGFQSERDETAPWSHWRANRMARRQSAVHRAALTFGQAWVTVLPGNPSPVIQGVSPRSFTAVYGEESDEWPVYALRRSQSWTPSGPRTLYRLYDDQAVYYLGEQGTGELAYVEHRTHGLGVCPVVRFVDESDLDEYSPGVVAPIIDIQDRLNYATFLLLMSAEHGAHRQRWAAGLELDDGEEPPIGPDRLLHSDSPETRFGSFEATDLGGHVAVLEQILRHLASVTQTPPHSLHGALTNIAADALDAAEAGLQRRVGERRTSNGESWVQVLRLACLADGDTAGWTDSTGAVRWRDTTTRSLAALVDAWGKAVQMLDVPTRATWERLPGVTDTDVRRWESMPKPADGHTLLANSLARATDFD